MEQITIEDFMAETEKEKEKLNKKGMPVWLEEAYEKVSKAEYKLQAITKEFGISLMVQQRVYYGYRINNDTRFVGFNNGKYEVFVGKTYCFLWAQGKRMFGFTYTFSSTYNGMAYINSETTGGWKEYKSIPANVLIIPVSEANISESAEKNFKYARDWYAEHGATNPDLSAVLCPEAEQLGKAGYVVAGTIVHILNELEDARSLGYFRSGWSTVENINRLLNRDGTKISNIFKTEKPVYEQLKNEQSLDTWDTYRKMYGRGKITKEDIAELYNSRITGKDMENINSILGMKVNGSQFVSLTGLLRYLERIDHYEAIRRTEGLQLIKDYFHMCSQLDMKPNLDSDSLKREHDVCARLVSQRRNEITAKKMKSACENLKKYDYEDDSPYFIRGIRSMDDLQDEARQQHNCVASYADWVADRKSYIFVCRFKKDPDRSYVTVELDPKTKKIKQKFLACNQPIRNKSTTEFLERWEKRCKTVKEA